MNNVTTDTAEIPTVSAAQAVAGRVATIEEALDVIAELRNRFNLAGTLFTPSDVDDMVATAFEGHDEEFGDALAPAVRDAVLAGYDWRKLGDQFTERGYEVVGNAISEMIGYLAAQPAHRFRALLKVEVEPGHPVEALIGQDFESAQAAYQWAKRHLGERVSTILNDPDGSPMRCHASTDRLASRVTSFSLGVVGGGRVLREFPVDTAVVAAALKAE